MFGDLYDKFELIAEAMLKEDTLEDILEANDLTNEEALAALIQAGLIEVPRDLELRP